jgi:hypothetical protein
MRAPPICSTNADEGPALMFGVYSIQKILKSE